MDLTLVDLQGLLPSPIILLVSVTVSSSTITKPLPEQVLNNTIQACDRALVLDSAKKKILDFVESRRMAYIAPNVSKLPKPLPVPDSEPKKKRSGRRLILLELIYLIDK
ncbi:U4/U6 small nuclear ribonucleoprotein Prp31-like [Trifolium pratense]|uniref:U4/U6 small nuclear ribonucleoprotein Prp31-like n=1 Tax=Trifolium pratense TaxID=57577 RepID=A0A2K3KBH7_TRIPR|nr:U4/U6 small nuclear ribonucleoprotein Prp31-like [Trifolium pratense]